MTKDEAKIRLRKEGYNVVDDNSVVTVLIAPDASLKNTVKDVESKLKALGYEASFSVRQVEDTAVSDMVKSSSDPVNEEDLPEDTDESMTETDEAGEENTERSGAVIADDGGMELKDKDEDRDKGAGEDDDNGSIVIDYLDDEDSDMLLTEDAVQFSLDDFGLDF